MSAESHQRIKELFLKARELPKAEQAAFVKRKAGEDEKLAKEVLELLAHDSDETILSIDQNQENTPRVDPLGLNKLNKHAKTGAWQKVFFSSRGRAGTALLVLAIIIGMLGYLAAINTRGELVRMRSEQTLSILKSNVQALRYWIHDYKSNTQMVLEDGDVRNAIVDLVEDISNERAHSLIDSIMQLHMAHNDADYYIITDMAGFIIHSPAKQRLGKRVSTEYGDYIYRASAGEEIFILPFYPPDPQDSTQRAARPYVWMQIPVRNNKGEYIGTFGLGRYADTDFTRIIRTAQMGQSGETYAIDKDGNFISESRFEPRLRELGLLPKDSAISSVKNLQARTFNYSLSKDVRTLTPLAALVVAAQESGAGFSIETVTKPSLDYKGDEVIGAWVWLPEFNFGMITQIETAEAFEPLWYLYVMISIAVILLVVASAFSFYSSAQLVEVRGQLGSAIEMGQYQVEKMIAEGGMGTVYLASHQLLKRKTAIKVIRLDKAHDEMAKRFEREVKLASQLSHPNTIEIFDYGITNDKQAFCAMEYLSGYHLGEVVKKDGPLPPARVIHILRQVCGSLQEAHALGLVHRDIKPQNIMLINKVGLPDFIKVLDFGLAKPLEQSANGDETRTITGTPVYLSPERLKRPGLAQPESDIYALGAVAYYLLAGKPIFTFSSDLDILYQVLNNEPEPLPEEVPEELRKLVEFCLEKEPENRLSDVAELKSFLDQLALQFEWSVADAENWWKKQSV
jgi:tRNA A-37 threonylcarbamoyl transferase component Bud32